MMNSEIQFGEILWTDFDPSVGHEFQGRRPALVIQSTAQIRKSNLVTIMPLTSQINSPIAEDILVRASSTNKLKTDSLLKVFDITSFDCTRFIKKIGELEAQSLIVVKAYLRVHFEL